MDQVEWLNQFLIKKVGNRLPDGRPLYAYRCDEREYETLATLVRDMLQGLDAGRSYKRFAELFCLLAAETWQRRYEGGPWAYDLIFSALGTGKPAQNKITDWIERGLSWWKRDVLISKKGRKQFLLTIGCEGGIPRKLLVRQESRLTDFFRELLTASRRINSLSEMELLARRNHHRLPHSLRQDVIFDLSARLVQAINELQPLVQGVDDPIETLDQARPGWRDVLPLPLGDEAIELLLGKLVRHAQKIRARATQQLHWRRQLLGVGQTPILKARLVLPEFIEKDQVIRWLGAAEPPRRLRMMLSIEDQSYNVAALTHIRRHEGEEGYRCESLVRRGLSFEGRLATRPSCLLLTDGEHDVEIHVPGSEGLDDLPWVFRDQEDGRGRLLLGVGSVRTHLRSVLVAVADGDEIETTGGSASVELAGIMERTGRRLYRIQGGAAVTSAMGDVYRIRCNAQVERGGGYRISGRQLAGILNGPVYLGMPRVEHVDEQGQGRLDPQATMEWMPVADAQRNWCRDTAACLGQIWLRSLDPEDGSILFRRRVEVVPKDCRVRIKVGTRSQPGFVEIAGLQGAELATQASEYLNIERQGDCARLVLSDEVPNDLVQVEVTLAWPDRSPLTLCLPVPRVGGAFTYGGLPLPRYTLIALDRLGVYRAEARGPDPGRYYIEVDVTATGGLDPDLRKLLWLRHSLKKRGDGVHEAILHPIQEPVGELMAMAADTDVRARLVLYDEAGRDLHRIQVARYDMMLEPDRENNCVCLAGEALRKLGEGWQDRVTVEMLPLWRPDEEPRKLSALEEFAGTAWAIPDDLEPGPWWIIGRDAGWTRFKPLLWTINREDEARPEVHSGEVGLANAVCEPDVESRVQLMDDLIRCLCEDMHHPDWDGIKSYLRLTKEHPAHTLEIMNAMVRHPESLVHLLMRSIDQDDLEQAWKLEREMPFAWWLIPAAKWQLVAQRYFYSLVDSLADLEDRKQIVEKVFLDTIERLGAQAHWLQVLCDWIQESVFPGMEPRTPEWKIVRSNPQGLLCQVPLLVEEMRRELMERIEPGIKWPEGMRVRERSQCLPEGLRFSDYGYRRDVFCAPFVAAMYFLQEEECPRSQVLELRRLRAFDQEWFDHSFALMICQGLASVLPGDKK